MRLYPIPGGTWAGTDADWKKEMKAAGLNPKEFEATKTREVPTGKKELMEFLTFFAVDVFRHPGAATGTNFVVERVDVDALRAEHNPDAVDATDAGTPTEQLTDLVALFDAAPVKLQAQLAVAFIDRLTL